MSWLAQLLRLTKVMRKHPRTGPGVSRPDKKQRLPSLEDLIVQLEQAIVAGDDEKAIGLVQEVEAMGLVDEKTNATLLKPAVRSACELNRSKVLQAIFARGRLYLVDQADAKGSTPLLIASYNGHEVVVRLLAGEFHADVNQAKANGATPS